MDRVSVVCHWWTDDLRSNRGYSFDAEHIRILRSMIARNITIPHEFVCVTPHYKMFDGVAGIRAIDWKPDKHIPGTVFARLAQHDKVFSQVIANGSSKILSLDIDVAVVGNIDHLFAGRGNFRIWRNPNFPQPQRAYFQSSVQCFVPGSRTCLYDDFDVKDTPKWVNWRFGGREQAWISERLPWESTEVYTAADGIYGAGRLKGAGIHKTLPDNACIVSFPGARAPWQPEIQEEYPWLKQSYRL